MELGLDIHALLKTIQQPKPKKSRRKPKSRKGKTRIKGGQHGHASTTTGSLW